MAMNDIELAGSLRRLDAAGRESGPVVGFDFDGLMARDSARKARARRRQALARGTASALVLAMVAVSVWRLDPDEGSRTVAAPPAAEAAASQPRLVRADTYLALAAIEDHIATIDDALSDARLAAPAADVARLERTRAELMDSYTRVRYAEMVSNTF